jgi:hypothetical protein
MLAEHVEIGITPIRVFVVGVGPLPEPVQSAVAGGFALLFDPLADPVVRIIFVASTISSKL